MTYLPPPPSPDAMLVVGEKFVFYKAYEEVGVSTTLVKTLWDSYEN